MPLRRESRSPRVSRIREAACLPPHALIRKAPFLLCAQNVHTTAATKAGPPASPSSARSTTPRPSATCSASPLAPSSPSSPLCSLRGCSSTLEVCISLVLCLAACHIVTAGTPSLARAPANSPTMLCRCAGSHRLPFPAVPAHVPAHVPLPALRGRRRPDRLGRPCGLSIWRSGCRGGGGRGCWSWTRLSRQEAPTRYAPHSLVPWS